MIVEAIAQATASSSTETAAAASAYALGDAGTEKFARPQWMLENMRCFAPGTRFVAFMRYELNGTPMGSGHYLGAERSSSGINWQDNQYSHGTERPRGSVAVDGDGWPILPQGNREGTDEKEFVATGYCEGAFIALTDGKRREPDEKYRNGSTASLVPVSASSTARYGEEHIARKAPDLLPPPWLSTLKEGDLLRDKNSYLCEQLEVAPYEMRKASASDAMRLRLKEAAEKGGAVVGGMTLNKGATGGKIVKFEQGKWSVAVRSAGSKVEPAWRNAAELMAAEDLTKYAACEPVWYQDLVMEIAVGVAKEIDDRSAEFTRLQSSASNWAPNAAHIYNDAAIIAVEGGLKAMFKKFGRSLDGIVLPSVDKNVFVVEDHKKFAFIFKLLTDSGLESVDGSIAAAIKLTTTELERRLREKLTKSDDIEADLERAITSATFPAVTKGSQVMINAKYLGDSSAPGQEASTFLHLLIHEAIHAGSVGGGGATVDRGQLNNRDFDEAITETLARAVSQAVNQVRASGTKTVNKDVIQTAVREIKSMTFGMCGCLRYQKEVDLIARNISDADRLKELLEKTYLGGGKDPDDNKGRSGTLMKDFPELLNP